VACELAHSLLYGYLDGELDAARSAEFERHLEGCSVCQAALDAQESLRRMLQREELRETAPASLRAKVRDLTRAPERRTSHSWMVYLRWAGAAVVLAFMVFVSWRALYPPQPHTASGITIGEIIDAHLRSLQPGHLTDITSADQHTVKPWFDGRLAFAPPVNDFAAAGFPLEGGRLDVLNAHMVAALVYGRRKHIINVFVWPTEQSDMAYHIGTTRGYNWIHWRHKGMEYCAMSDASLQDVHELADLLSR
jgi:mycothiol system anti-sigma-R factor